MSVLSSRVETVRLEETVCMLANDWAMAGLASNKLMLVMMESNLGSIFWMAGIMSCIFPKAPALMPPGIEPPTSTRWRGLLANSRLICMLPIKSLSISAVLPKGMRKSLLMLAATFTGPPWLKS